MYERILVAVDWSESTDAVLEHARGLALLTGAMLHVLHVRTTDFPSVPQMLDALASRALTGGLMEAEPHPALRAVQFQRRR